MTVCKMSVLSAYKPIQIQPTLRSSEPLDKRSILVCTITEPSEMEWKGSPSYRMSNLGNRFMGCSLFFEVRRRTDRSDLYYKMFCI